MSTLIERMILRSRAPLSSLEPITPVRYAPTTPGQQPDEPAFGDMPSAHAEAPDQGLPPPDRSSRQNARLGSAQPASPSLAPPRTASLGPVTPGHQDPGAARRDRRTAVSQTGRVLDHELPPHNERMPAARGWPSEDAVLQAADTADPTAPAPPIPATARLNTADLAEPSAAASPPQVREPASATTAASADGTKDGEHDRGPDITVTIGHIEVRAAPAATPARPAGPAFRPQVSLTDFLNGAQGSRR